MISQEDDIRKLTVVPSARLKSNVLPAGTVNAFMFTVVHLTAAETSSSDEIVPVQSVAEGAATMNGRKARRPARRRNVDIVINVRESWEMHQVYLRCILLDACWFDCF